jgi:hypothetical protein
MQLRGEVHPITYRSLVPILDFSLLGKNTSRDIGPDAQTQLEEGQQQRLESRTDRSNSGTTHKN